MDNADTRTGVWRRVRFVVLAAVAMTPLACGQSGPEMASVSGKVTYNGKPVTKGTITFVTASPGGRNATGAIQPDGSYKLQTENPGDGAQLGDYNVTVYAHDEEVLQYTPTTPVKPKPLTPAKYENPKTTDLKATVKKGSNPLDFELKD